MVRGFFPFKFETPDPLINHIGGSGNNNSLTFYYRTNAPRTNRKSKILRAPPYADATSALPNA